MKNDILIMTILNLKCFFFFFFVLFSSTSTNQMNLNYENMCFFLHILLPIISIHRTWWIRCYEKFGLSRSPIFSNNVLKVFFFLFCFWEEEKKGKIQAADEKKYDTLIVFTLLYFNSFSQFFFSFTTLIYYVHNFYDLVSRVHFNLTTSFEIREEKKGKKNI